MTLTSNLHIFETYGPNILSPGIPQYAGTAGLFKTTGLCPSGGSTPQISQFPCSPLYSFETCIPQENVFLNNIQGIILGGISSALEATGVIRCHLQVIFENFAACIDTNGDSFVKCDALLSGKGTSCMQHYEQ